ncbi:hypothetical protein DFJ63DRAFT_313409 [Scheffersomyces coipomensis]|uniref:uncharacterized protein n=1 Tax=Scheffersomyces coipomensis TaxID=1788519 RepID=UPI00315C8EAA
MSSPIITESFLKWDPAQVSSYILSVLPSDEQRSMSTTFLDNNIEGSLLPFITTEHLKELGIQKLHTRLLIKKAIGELITNHYVKNPPQSLNDPEYNLNNININNNYVSLESLTLSTVLIKDMIKKIASLNRQSHSGENSAESPNSNLDLKKLNDNFIKLKTDLIPVIRLLKDSKPLPTPTLDPGPASNLDYLDAGNNNNNDDSTISASNVSNLRNMNMSRSNSVNSPSALTNNSRSTSSTPSSGNSGNNITSTTVSNSTSTTSIPSPTYSNRFSSGSILSMGTGKVIQQTIPKVSSNHDFKVVNLSNSGSNRNLHDLTNEQNQSQPQVRPKLVETKSSSTLNTASTTTTTAPLKPPLKAQSSFINGTNSNSSSNTTSQSNTPTATTTSTVTTPTTATHSNEPLKQLRASTEDSCLKILQQAMKRHHIPRDDWSKYVLVICYGDKERILKLGEKPVVIFKELQELGKHPAIMLRQLATANEDSQGNPLYEDSRIGDDIPGGTL